MPAYNPVMAPGKGSAPAVLSQISSVACGEAMFQR